MAGQLSGSIEDYLEAVYALKKDRGYVRAKDVAATLGVSLPSVTGMLKRLSLMGLVIYERYGMIRLTGDGRRIACSTYKKHGLLVEFFTSIGLDKKTALRDACRAEHALSGKTIRRLGELARKGRVR